MFFLTIRAEDARRLGYLVAGNPLRDRAEQDEFVDIRLEADDVPGALARAAELAEGHQLEYWELFRVTQIAGRLAGFEI